MDRTHGTLCQLLSCRGDVLEVKVLGILAMVDDGETDWKVIGWFSEFKSFTSLTLVPCALNSKDGLLTNNLSQSASRSHRCQRPIGGQAELHG